MINATGAKGQFGAESGATPLAPNPYRDTVGGQALKRAMDFIGCAIGFTLCGPIMIVLAVLIKLDSKGPVFYRGLRTGRGNTRFHIYKFRSMVADAEKVGTGTTSKGDPRITRMGRIIRKLKLDEVPQLINVLIGDMSFVGPRPELPEHTDAYEGEELCIHMVRPGITDFSSLEFIQLGEVVGEQDAHQYYIEHVRPIKNKLRVRYVREMRFGTDMKLVGLTMAKIFRRRR
jgi:lipopolysaccharide/colanic/teichoic acid biosynthesis glycosyltransferase